MVARNFIGAGMSKRLVLRICRISRSAYYYKPREGRAGRPLPGVTITRKGLMVSDSIVVSDITELLAEEFVDYGYYKTTIHLREEKNYLINHKKVYRLMKENDLLLPKRRSFSTGSRQWVKELVPDPQTEFSYLEFDIKYIYVQGRRANAQVLTVLDVFSRWNMAQTVKWNIRQGDVVALFETIFEHYQMPERFYVRNDNGSQRSAARFVADAVQKYFRDRKVVQEFTKPATPEQNAHIDRAAGAVLSQHHREGRLQALRVRGPEAGRPDPGKVQGVLQPPPDPFGDRLQESLQVSVGQRCRYEKPTARSGKCSN